SRHILYAVCQSLTPTCVLLRLYVVFFLTDPAPTQIYTLSLHDALPISIHHGGLHFDLLAVKPDESLLVGCHVEVTRKNQPADFRSEEHTSELQSRFDLVCRLLLEKKKNMKEQRVRRLPE